MKIRPFLIFCGVPAIVLAAFFMWRGELSDADVTAVAQAPTRSHPEQGLIDDLVLANRMVASQELAFVDAYGHVSVRSRSHPDHFFISRYVSPGIVTADDILENDLDSKPVTGERSDQYQERFLHGEIYKARPDVMAIVHSHTPELVAFSVSSVPLRSGDDVVPIFDIRKFNNGRSGIISTPALGRSFAESLGKSNAILLLGHGALVVSSSIYNAVSSANGLRTAARIQQQLISMGGTWDSNPRRVTAPPGPRIHHDQEPPRSPRRRPPAWRPCWRPRAAQAAARAAIAAGNTGNNLSCPTSPARTGFRAAAARPRRRVVVRRIRRSSTTWCLANRMLASKELGILDAFGHVSVRNPRNPNHYFISRYVSAGVVKAGDIIENDLDSKPVAGPRSDEYQEVYLHGEIYKARPDVMAVLHAHTPELLAFTESSVALRPVVNGGAFIGDGLPLHDIRKFDPRETLIRTPALGRSVAMVLGNKPGVLLRGHGIALTDASLRLLVVRAYNLRMNARIQQQAIALGGKVTSLEDPPGAAAAPPAVPNAAGADAAYNRGWEYWKQIVSTN